MVPSYSATKFTSRESNNILGKCNVFESKDIPKQEV